MKKLKLKKSERNEITYAFGLLMQLGLYMLIPILGCLLIGKFLDDIFHTAPLFLVIFIIIGVMASFRNLYVYSMRGFGHKK